MSAVLCADWCFTAVFDASCWKISFDGFILAALLRFGKGKSVSTLLASIMNSPSDLDVFCHFRIMSSSVSVDSQSTCTSLDVPFVLPILALLAQTCPYCWCCWNLICLICFLNAQDKCGRKLNLIRPALGCKPHQRHSIRIAHPGEFAGLS